MIKASDTVVITFYRDTNSITRYYNLYHLNLPQILRLADGMILGHLILAEALVRYIFVILVHSQMVRFHIPQ